MNNKLKSSKDALVLALDVDTKEQAIDLVNELKDYIGTYKIGLQLLMSEGPEFVRYIKSQGCKIFLDGKFHDIPNTVAKASANAVRLEVDIFNIHASGGSNMLKAAVKETITTAKNYNLKEPIILGVTLLSSIDQEILSKELKISDNINNYVTQLAKLSKECGLGGVVASVKEASLIRSACGNDFVILCPGIRPEWSLTNDQKRVATPYEAMNNGANLLVVGRPITEAPDKIWATKKILDEIELSLNNKRLVLNI
ncbi:MAG: orotidine-5'-phosphate decarboxylase [Cyanobacteriota bacterium]